MVAFRLTVVDPLALCDKVSGSNEEEDSDDGSDDDEAEDDEEEAEVDRFRTDGTSEGDRCLVGDCGDQNGPSGISFRISTALVFARFLAGFARCLPFPFAVDVVAA